MPSANYRCRECGFERDFLFDGPPPAVHTFEHDDQLAAVEPADAVDVAAGMDPLPEGADRCSGRLDRVWGGKANTPGFGHVKGAGGSPPR